MKARLPHMSQFAHRLIMALALAACAEPPDTPAAAPAPTATAPTANEAADDAAPPAPAAPTAPPGDELLPNPGLADGARGWELHGAEAQPDLGPEDGPAVLLGPSSRLALTIPAPAGAPVRFALAAQGLSPDTLLRVAFTALAPGEPVDDEAAAHDQSFRLEPGQWLRKVWRYDVPAGAERLRVRIETERDGRALVARASLMVEDYALEALDAEGVTRLTLLIEPDVERLRGLLFKRPVPVQVVDDAQAREFFDGRVRKFWPQERQEADEAAYRQLGLWPTEQSMLDAMLDLMEEQAGGFYDPETETFYVLGDMPKGAAAIIIAHELTHALDDQHYGLDERIAALLDDTDRFSGYGAVVEGSGTVIMSKYMADLIGAGRLDLSGLAEMQQSEAMQGQALAAAPPYLSRSLIFSYVMGMHLLLRGQGQLAINAFDAADIDRCFRQPPQSSEQVLHPEDYWEQPDEPRPVPLPDLSATLGGGWTLRRSDTLGELLLPILTGGGAIDATSLEIAVPSAWTGYATIGWGGDLWQLYEAPTGAGAEGGAADGGKRHVTLLATLWDTPQDAEEFAGALTAPA
ncbi:MAG TPA: hypothetical protein VFD43_14100, partial [Planctomycetota bacterium]|nr:hypothetical protein [Planctomycetota bacterium]